MTETELFNKFITLPDPIQRDLIGPVFNQTKPHTSHSVRMFDSLSLIIKNGEKEAFFTRLRQHFATVQ